MPALNFQKQFAELVRSGKKRQTFRRCRKDGRDPQKGTQLYLYTGMRTKSCKKLMEAECISSNPATIDESGIFINGERLAGDEEHSVSVADGFECFYDLKDWMKKTHGLPVTGYLIRW